MLVFRPWMPQGVTLLGSVATPGATGWHPFIPLGRLWRAEARKSVFVTGVYRPVRNGNLASFEELFTRDRSDCPDSSFAGPKLLRPCRGLGFRASTGVESLLRSRGMSYHAPASGK